MDLTLEQMETEYWAYHYFEQPPGEEFDDDDFDEDAISAEIEARALAKQQAPAVEDVMPPNIDDWEDIEIKA